MRQNCRQGGIVRFLAAAALLGLVTLAGHLTPTGQAREKPDPADSVERDYSDELPRIKPTEPADALATIQILPGLRVDQLAQEPLVTDPVAMAFDADGRLFVVQMNGYSEDGEKLLGQVCRLTDEDGDGSFDQSTVYASGLSWPTAVTCFDGGIYVGAPPHIYYFKDTTGDGKANISEIAFTGFGRGNVQGLLNTFKWGLDNRIHGATSSSGATVTRIGGEPMEPLVLRGRDFSFDPRSRDIIATSGGGQHGLSFDRWGNKFVCRNSNHLQQIMYDDRYVARNPYLAPPAARVDIATDGPQADVFRVSPVEPWRIVRTRLRKQGIVPGPVEGGGTAAGYFTGSTGVTIYRGNAWPREMQGLAVIGDVGSNLVHRKQLTLQGIGYQGQRLDKQTEFLRSTDIWFRPVQFANAPDGCLYLADMYREVIEHPLSLHPVIKKHLDLTSGRDRGRIYRVAPEGFVQPPPVRLAEASTKELVQLLDHDNGWHRETAHRLLFERQDLSSIKDLEQLATSASHPQGRIRVLWTLVGLQQLQPVTLLAALADEHPRVRQHAVRLSENLLDRSAAVRDKLLGMNDDDDLQVRYQLAFTLGQLANSERRNRALAAIARQSLDEAYLRMAIQSSLVDGAGEVLGLLASDRKLTSSAAGQLLLGSLAAQIGRQQQARDVAGLLRLASQLAKSDAATLQLIVKSVAAKPGSNLETQLAAATGGKASELLKSLVSQASRQLQAGGKPAQRVQALETLQLASFEQTSALFPAMLAPTQPAQVQQAALATLSSYRDPAVADLLLEHWASFSPRLRGQAGDLLLSRPVWVKPLLAAIEAGKIRPGDVAPDRYRILAASDDSELAGRASKLLAQMKLTGRGDVVKQYQQALELPGDATRGQAVFKKVCAACHRLQGVGHQLAPNLAAMRNRGDAAIVSNVMNPNQEVNPQFLNYTVITADGRTLTGIIAEETATSITLKRAENASDAILRIDIDAIRSTGMSLMPEGMEKQIDVQAMADLLEYLRSVD